MPVSDAAIREKAASGGIDFTVHALFEGADDFIFIDEVEQALQKCEIIEHLPDHERCLVFARLEAVGGIHVVIDFADWLADPNSNLVVVTVYRPDPDRWIDGRTRRS